MSDDKPVPTHRVLQAIQRAIHAPKDKRSNHARYNYRSCEGILEELKPILEIHGAAVLVSDAIVAVGDRHYVAATATLMTDGGELSATAYAREAVERSGLDVAQVTGSASSYARKYALGGLFALDDSKDDPDAAVEPAAAMKPAAPPVKPAPPPETAKLTPAQIKHLISVAAHLLSTCRDVTTEEEIGAIRRDLGGPYAGDTFWRQLQVADRDLAMALGAAIKAAGERVRGGS